MPNATPRKATHIPFNRTIQLSFSSKRFPSSFIIRRSLAYVNARLKTDKNSADYQGRSWPSCRPAFPGMTAFHIFLQTLNGRELMKCAATAAMAARRGAVLTSRGHWHSNVRIVETLKSSLSRAFLQSSWL